MPGFYQITVRKDGLNVAAFDALLSTSAQWLRLTSTTWMIQTDTQNAGDLYVLCYQTITASDGLFICKMDPSEKQGWLPKWVWDWINERSKPQGLAALASPRNPLLGI